MIKVPQRILDKNAAGGGTNWGIEAIPDTFEEFEKLFSDYPQYRKAKETKTKMQSDYKLLNTDYDASTEIDRKLKKDRHKSNSKKYTEQT